MGIVKRRKQPHLFREGARHAAHDASALSTARHDVQRAAIATFDSHDHLDYPVFADQSTATDDSTDELTTLSESDSPPIPHPELTSDPPDDVVQKPKGRSSERNASGRFDRATEDLTE